MLTNALPLLQPIFYEKPAEQFFYALTSLFNAVVAIILAVLGLILQRFTQKSVPHVAEEVEKRY